MEIDSQKFNNDPVNVKEANPFPGIHRGKVPNPLFLDDRLTREVMDIYEGFVSHQPLIGDKKHTNPIINAKEANHLTETVTGSHLSGVVPQNSRNPLKRKDGGGSLHVLEDGRKLQSKTVPPNSRQIEKAPKKPNPLFQDDRLTREVMDIYEGFVSHQPLIGDKKHTNPIINAKEANHLTETVTGIHLSGVVPQNSRNPLKRSGSSEWGEFLQDLEDGRKIQSKTVPSNSRQIENHRSIAKKQRKAENVENIQPIDEKKMKNVLEIRKPSKKDWESALQFFEKDSPLDDEVMKSVIDEYIEQSSLEYDWKNWDFVTPHPSNPIINSADGSVRKLSQDSSIPIKKAIDTSRATRVFSKLPRFLK